MKIVYISNSIIPSRTANSIHVMKMCNTLSELGYEVFLLAPNRKKEYEKNVQDVFKYYNIKQSFNIVKLPYPNFYGRSIIYAISCYFKVKNLSPDLIYGRFLRGCYASTFSKKPLVIELHSPVNNDLYWYKKILKYKNLKKIIVISDALKKKILQDHVISSELLFIAHDAADIPKKLVPNKKNDSKTTFNVGYIGHLYKGKGVEVIEQIAPKLNDISFHIVGGLQKDISLWKEKVNSKNVIFHGFMAQNKLHEIFDILDVCILPNQKFIEGYSSGKGKSVNISSYTSPLKMFEYMAHKKPIIASDIPVLREVLNENNAILVKPNDYDAWRKAIIKLKEDSNHRERISSNAYNDFIKNHTWKCRAEAIMTEVFSALNNKI